MPTRRAFAPRAVPLHLPRFARGRLAPDREVGGVAFAFDFFDAAFSVLGFGARQCAVIGDGRGVEIQAAFQLVAMLVGNALANSIIAGT